MDRERIPYAPPYRRKSILNEFGGLWHKEPYHSSTKRGKRYGNDGAGRIASNSGSGKYSLRVSTFRLPSHSVRGTLYLKQGAFLKNSVLKKFLTTLSYMYKRSDLQRDGTIIMPAPLDQRSEGNRAVFIRGAGVGNADDPFDMHGFFREREVLTPESTGASPAS
jgi:hypothetical protein